MAYVTDANKELTMQLYANPMLLQDKILSMFENHVFDGKQVLDGNNVFTFGLEMEATMVASIVNEMSGMFEALYPERAKTMNDLYRHMSDYDFVGVFATPAMTRVGLMFDRDWIVTNAVPLKDGSGTCMIRLPSYSKFTIGEYKFGLYYPINIEVRKKYTENGDLDIENTLIHCQWDDSIKNPLYGLTTNIIEHRITRTRTTTYCCLDIPIYQFVNTIIKSDLVSSTGFLQRYDYTDQFYAVRVFHWLNNSWHELPITLSDVVYNPDKAVAKIKVLTDLAQVEVSIPQVYFSQGMLGNKVMIMLYTTKGVVNVDLRGYAQDQFAASFLVNDDVLDPTYSEMLKRIPTVFLTPISQAISGGSNQSNVPAVKSRIVNSAGSDDVLVTNAQVAEYLRDLGFDCTKYIDNITDRIWLAKKEITDSLGNTVSSALYKALFTDEIFSNIEDYDSIKAFKNGSSYMLFPTSIFKYDEDTDSMVLLSTKQKNELLNKPTDSRIYELNSNPYMATPFHIKIQTDDELPVATAYNLFNPTVDAITFVSDNNFTSTQVSIYGMSIEHLNNGIGGYKVSVILYKTNDLHDVVPAKATPTLKRNITAIMRVRNRAGVNCFIEGNYAGKNSSGMDILTFTIGTDYNISEDGYFGTESMSLVSASDALSNNYNEIPLSGDWDILFFVRKEYIPEMESYNIRVSGIPRKITDQEMVFVAQQKASITFGKTISALRNNMFVTSKGRKYSTHPTTIFATYGNDVYRRWDNQDCSYEEQEIPEGELANIHEIDGKKYCHDLEVVEHDDKSYVKVPFSIGDVWYNFFTLEMELVHNEGDLLLSSSDGDKSLKTPAMSIVTKYDNGNPALQETLWEDPTTPYSEPSDMARFIPQYLDGDRNIISTYENENGEVIKYGYSTIEVDDYLSTIINYIQHRQHTYETPESIVRNFVQSGDSYYFDTMQDCFVYVENAASDKRTIPEYKIVIDDESLKGNDPKYKLKLLKFSDGTSVQDLVRDYYSEKDINGNIERRQIEGSEYGCLYTVDNDLVKYNHNADISDDDLYKFYQDYDNGLSYQELISKYKISATVADKLLKLRFPWKKVCYAGHFWCIKDYHIRRSLMNFNSSLLIGTSVGLAAIGHLQKLIKNPDKVVRYPEVSEAISYLNSLENKEEFVWVSDYNPVDDNCYSSNNLDSEQNFIPLINKGDVKHGALLLNDLHTSGVHFVIATGDTLEECFDAIKSINSRSGSCYVRTPYPKNENTYIEPISIAPINTDIDVSNNSSFDVRNWPWEMKNWISGNVATGLLESVEMSLDKENSYAKIVHEQGDVIIGSDGKPVVDSNGGNGLNYAIDLVVYDYKPLQQTSKLAESYNEFVRNLVMSYCESVVPTRERMLERTRVYYAPIRTFGLGDFKAANGDTFTHNLEISLRFKLHVPVSVIRDNSTKSIIRNNILSIVKKHLKTGNLNLVDIADEIKSTMSDNIYYIDIDGVDGDDSVQTLIAANKDICRPYLKQILVRDNNNAVVIDDALTLEYAALV